MNHKVTIVALTKFNDIWQVFAKNIHNYVPRDVSRIVVVDGNNVVPAYPWGVIRGPKVFSMAGNYNLGMRAADKTSDLLLLNDDITFLKQHSIEQLQDLAYSDPIVGAVACCVKIGRVGNPLQENPHQDRPLTFVRTCGNGTTYFKREVIDKIGYMDDVKFTEAYGAEDADYTWRINMAGYRVGIARDVHVKHGFGHVTTHSATSGRTLGMDMTRINKIGIRRWEQKYGLPFSVVHGEWRDDWRETL